MLNGDADNDAGLNMAVVQNTGRPSFAVRVTFVDVSREGL